MLDVSPDGRGFLNRSQLALIESRTKAFIHQIHTDGVLNRSIGCLDIEVLIAEADLPRTRTAFM